MQKIVEPHPLDFDWRFDASAVAELLRMLPSDGSILTLGCPSLARKLSENGRDALLVDRQPIQSVAAQIQLDIQEEQPTLSGFAAAIVDPPWYPEHVRRWIAWAANCVVDGGEILASIWPEGTRPSGENEYHELKEWLGTWAEVSQPDYQPRYETPFFELRSELFSQGGELATSPRLGRLVKLKLIQRPVLPKPSLSSEIWTRFVFNNYQIAVRNRNEKLVRAAFNRLPNANGWIWPYVSRRAPQREKIDVWSSRSEVAHVDNASLLIDTLRKASTSVSDEDFTITLSAFPSLLEWEIPRPPYWRTQEWSHRQ